MSDLERRTRATSFGSAADDYSRHRPAPPAEAAAWAVGADRAAGGALGAAGANRAAAAGWPVADLAAGTGNLTGHVLDLGLRTVAVDIDPRMLAVLGRRLPGAGRLAARGEQLPLRAASLAAVVISSAWHWLDHDRAWPELARVIRPGGYLGILRSGPDYTVGWVKAVLGPRLVGGSEPAVAVRRYEVHVPGGAPFSAAEERTFYASVPYRVDDLPGLVCSYSRVLTLPPAARAEVRRQVEVHVANDATLRGRTTVELPLRAQVWRAFRNPRPNP